jgi:3-dehydroquinate dehydratase-2
MQNNVNKILIINGPNLNMLGTREPEIYGYDTLADIATRCEEEATHHGLEVDFRQSNHEGEIITWIQQARGTASAIIINPGAYSHTSIAIMDALLSVQFPVIEVHISNIFKREPFRHHSFISTASNGVICGLGAMGYNLAIQAVAQLIS